MSRPKAYFILKGWLTVNKLEFIEMLNKCPDEIEICILNPTKNRFVSVVNGCQINNELCLLYDDGELYNDELE